MSDYQIYRAATGDYDISLHFVFEWNRDREWNFHEYCIPVTTIWYVLEGRRKLIFSGEEYFLEPGSIVILPSHEKVTTLHVAPEHEPIRYLSMGIQSVIGGIECHQLFGIPPVFAITESSKAIEFKTIWLELVSGFYRLGQQGLELSAGNTGFALSIEAKTKQWLSLMIQLAEPFMKTPNPVSDKRVREICTYIRDHFANSLSSEEIASAVCLSEGHMRALFRRYMFMSPHQYILEVRMEKAKELLGTSVLSLTDIAERVGFEDVSYFIHTFRRREGMTPAVYRKLLYPWRAN